MCIVQVSTPIYYVRSRSKVSICIIVGSVVGGLLVLVVIIVVLRRVSRVFSRHHYSLENV